MPLFMRVGSRVGNVLPDSPTPRLAAVSIRREVEHRVSLTLESPAQMLCRVLPEVRRQLLGFKADIAGGFCYLAHRLFIVAFPYTREIVKPGT